MKLERITLLSEYKNIQIGGTLGFSTQNYTTLVGANGSGKSN
jgi:ABC-type Mn2+/Zn2+ transport system ATPase subunit